MKPDFGKFPDKIGIYFFLNKLGEIIYIGKAKNLKNVSNPIGNNLTN